MTEQHKTVIRGWFDEVWNQGREASIDELFPADGVAHGLGDSEQDVHGPAEFKPFVANMRGVFPGTQIDVDDIFSDDGSPVTMETMLDFASRHNIAPQNEHYPMSRINETFARLESGKARYRIVLDADFE